MATNGATDGQASGSVRWLPRILGAALLAAVIVGATHFSEERAFVRLAEHAEPGWLALAVLLQVGTYLAQGSIWRRVADAVGYRLSRTTAFELGLAKLFADQALPSAGLSSSILIAKALAQRQLPPAAVKASILVNIASYHLAYAIALVGALVIVVGRGQANALVMVTGVLFLIFSLGLGTAVLGLAGRRHERLARMLDRFPAAHTLFDFLAGADGRLVRSPRMLADSMVLQGAIVLLDAATVWTLIGALGETASAAGVFAAFMIASLFRTMGIVPGGLGTFELTSVLMLRTVGVDLAVALSATLLFRGLSFWLPMLPGYWVSHRVIAATRHQPQQAEAPPGRQPASAPYWAVAAAELSRQLRSGPEGLSAADAAARLQEGGPNVLHERHPVTHLSVFMRQVRSPLLLLVFAAGASAIGGEWFDAAIVLSILLATVGVGYSREYSAHAAVAALGTRLHARARVLRDGHAESVLTTDIVPGDVVLLSAGSLVPADAVIIDATDFFLMFRGRPPVETLLFAVALAVGLSPELLPAILSIDLARGAQMMARHGVLVRRLNAIENLGSMDVLCTDKTGTLTEGAVQRAPKRLMQ